MRAKWVEIERWSHLVWDDPSSPQTSMIYRGESQENREEKERSFHDIEMRMKNFQKSLITCELLDPRG